MARRVLHGEAREHFSAWEFLPPWDTLEQAFIAGYLQRGFEDNERAARLTFAVATGMIPTTSTESTIYLSPQ